MLDNPPHFDEQDRLIAPKYGDVYFSAEDGLAETRHVFLEGNRLAERFAAMKPGACFTIGETGFGTGLNFLAAWRLFEQVAPQDARLDFVSVEGLPLSRETMDRALSPWAELGAYRGSLLEQWGPILPGMQRLRFANGRVRLTLLVGPVDEALPSIDASVDAWFLDGFAPSRNPEMWSDAVFSEIARLSAHQATLATYTAAGFVRRGLDAAGFDIEKRPGFGTKRDMTVGDYRERGRQKRAVKDAVVIGGSLAGAFAARSLAERGVSVTVIERQHTEAGELPSLQPRVSVLQPKISDISDRNGGWLREGYAFMERWLRSDAGLSERVGWVPCGSFQTRPADGSLKSQKQMQRYQRFNEQFNQTGLCSWIDADATEREVGLALLAGGLLVERAGLLRPAGLCTALLEHPLITMRDGVSIKSLKQIASRWAISQSDGIGFEAEAVVLACATEALSLVPHAGLELKPVRGQVTMLDTASQCGELTGLRRALFYGGYLLPECQGHQTLGASFVPGDAGVDWRLEEHVFVCEKLCDLLASNELREVSARLKALADVHGWSGIRTTTPTHRCYAQAIGEGLYASLGHGSHGIASAARAAEHLADLMTGGVVVT